MDQDSFNISLRKFLKRVGVTSQREIEQAVEHALQDGKLTGNESLPVKVTLTVPGLDLNHTVEDEIKLE